MTYSPFHIYIYKEAMAGNQNQGEVMDCCICSPMASVYRPPRNTICRSCYEGGHGMVSFLKEFKPTTVKGISDAFQWMKEIKEKKERLEEKMNFLESFVVAFKEGIHTDILLQPGNGPPIPAHRALLSSKSEIFRTMLSKEEGFKGSSSEEKESICLPELTHDDLHYLLQFLYTGNLEENDRCHEQNMMSLLISADKYEIPFLRSICEQRILQSLTPLKALPVLEVAERCSSLRLREKAMEAVVRHAEEVVFSVEYENFAFNNGNLVVDITRAIIMDQMKMKTTTTTTTTTN